MFVCVYMHVYIQIYIHLMHTYIYINILEIAFIVTQLYRVKQLSWGKMYIFVYVYIHVYIQMYI